MKYELIQKPDDKYSAKQQVLINRGIAFKDLAHYMNLTDDDINEPETFGEELMDAAAECFLSHLDTDHDICIVVDCDCDGYTSSAILINYIYDLKSEEYIDNHISWYMHEGKVHGLVDSFNWIEDVSPDFVIIPDAGSNDIEYLQKLEDHGIDVLILDHHEVEEQDFWRTLSHPHLFLINSQSPTYPNKFLSGAGVVWQFCRYIDKIKNTDYADWYLDLVALGLDGDMMSLHSFETRRLITKGLDPKNIHNPFMFNMWEKNKFKLGDAPTAWGATFYIVPLVNAITRSGTLDEKELIFNSMLKFKAFKEIPSNKRGHKVGETERLVTQAIRTCTNVKNRQTRAEEAGIDLVTSRIEENHMLDHKVLLFLLEPGEVDRNIAGLIANKIMAKYQRPCCMLTKTEVPIEVKSIATPSVTPLDDPGYISISKEVKTDIVYSGSARGCDKVGVTEFKDICAGTGVTTFVAGHQGAFGLGLPANKINSFLESTDAILYNMPNEATYHVDYIWRANEADPQAIIDIGEMDEFWGKDVDESLIAITGIQVTKDNLTMMKSNTVKISLPNNISIIKFRMSDEEFNTLYSENGVVEIDIVGKCNINEWAGNRYPQIFLEDYNIIGRCAYVF